jgi:hypothetical protein
MDAIRSTHQDTKANRHVGVPGIHRLLPRAASAAIVATVSAVELIIADRKYGVFTGGFGQPEAIDTLGERLLFLGAYVCAQAALALLVWCLCLAAVRRGQQWTGPWTATVHFAFAFGGAMLAALIARYQLHSYFSDAVDFALLKNLGGGSLKDALLFGKNELALGFGALGGLILAWWLAARAAHRWLRSPPGERQPRTPWRLAGIACALWLLALALAPRIAQEEARALERTLGWSAAAQLAAALTDFDGDGYGLFGLQIDRHPFDAARHPLALDVPGNGIDEDGYGGDLALVSIPSPRPETLVPAKGPHVMLVVLESTRSEAIGKRIDGQLVAPHLTALAAGGTAITPSFSHVGFTTASLKSIFAGDLAPRPGAPSLFRELARSGYRVSVFSGQPEDFGAISATVGMREHADLFVDAETLRDKRAFSFAAQGSLLVDEQVLLEEFDRHFASAPNWAAPQFVYLNFQSAHFPYDHPGVPHRFAHPPIARAQITAANKEDVQRTYWNAVAHADAALGAVIKRLKTLGAWDQTVMLVTGDHGEALFEQGFLGHGHVIDHDQSATFLALNRAVPALTGPVALSDYRGVLLDLLRGERVQGPSQRPFMHIGDLDHPSTIGMAGTEFGIVSLRLDRGTACFERPRRCRAYGGLAGAEKQVVDALVARWGSERWARRSPP